jgi:type IV pilus assembly protein PilB
MNSGNVAFEAQLIVGGLSSVDLAVAKQHAVGERIQVADAIVALGLVDETDSYASLAAATGLRLVDLEQTTISELAIHLVSERLARRHLVVPIHVDNRSLTYATFQPFDGEAERDLSFAAGRRATAVLATRTSILAALDRLYPKLQELERLADRLRGEGTVVELGEMGSSDVPGASPVIDLCNQLIGRAVEVGASDLHIECTGEGASVRFRICGVLEPVMTLPASASHPVLNRFKIMAKADISVRFRPQDGAFRVVVNGRPIDVRLSTLPTVGGEKIVMRVIDSHSPLQALDRLGYDDQTMARLRKSLLRPDGLVLVTGPTGSGKTTALYAALGHLRTGQTNIVSVEDPVERTVAGVTQIPVNGRSGNTFPIILRSILRQDPNIIMVGEIRDSEVAQIVGQAAYTGHLVLSSLHTTDAASAVTRLMNLGLEPFKIAESLTAVLAQRLVRCLCPHCRRMHDDLEARRLGSAHGLKSIPASAGPGCEHCKQTAYLGRAPIAELLTPSEELRMTIARGATSHEIRAAMNASGMPSMRHQALALVTAGITSIEEIDRVLAADDTEIAPARSGRRVLVCDDEPITRMLVKLLLEREHYVVLEASTGREGLEIARRERPDLLLVDLNMPEMDGYEAIAQVRRELTLTTMPVVVLTSEEGPGVERRVLDLGADDYIIKPFDAEVLLSRVHAVFRRLTAAVAA